MIEPLLSDDAFLADVQSVRGTASLYLWWLGQSGFLLSDGTTFVLIDPFLSEMPDRLTRRPIDPGRLGFVSSVACTHDHRDHFDPGTILPILQANPELHIVIPESSRVSCARKLDLPPTQLKGVTQHHAYMADDIAFHGVPAAHDTIEYDQHGHCTFLGYLITVGPYNVYHAGDTVWWQGLEGLLRWWRVDFALLPISGRHAGVRGNLVGHEAAHLARQINCRCVIPCHYDMFQRVTANPQDSFVPECRKLAQNYRVLQAGERFNSAEFR